MADEDDTDVTEEALDEAVEGEDGEGGGKKKSKKKLIIILVVLLLIGGGGAGAYFSGLLGGSNEVEVPKEENAEEALKKAGEKHYYGLPEFLVNLNTSSRQSSFLKMVIILDLVDKKDEKLIEANLPRINDSFNTYMRELRPSDLYGSAGLYRLREELLDRINKIIAPAAVNDILFKQILVQ